jgi:hypothetical protein
LSVTTLVGTPLIRSVKRGQTADPDQAKQTLTNMGMAAEVDPNNVVFGRSAVPAALVAPPVAFGAPAAGAVAGAGGGPVSTVVAHNEGTIVALTSPNLTGWADLVRGEETGNSDKLDLGKLQLLYVTAVAILVYGALMFTSLGQVGDGG